MKKTDIYKNFLTSDPHVFKNEDGQNKKPEMGKAQPKLGSHFIFSAENPYHKDKNSLNLTHEQALNFLKQKGYHAEELKGKYGQEERSIIVHNPPKHAINHLMNMSAALGQDSSIISDGKNHEMHFHHGDAAGKHVKGQGTTFHEQPPEDFYSTTASGHHFTHNFDFDNAHDSHKSQFLSAQKPAAAKSPKLEQQGPAPKAEKPTMQNDDKMEKSERRPYPDHLPKFKRGDKVHLSHGVTDLEHGGEKVNRDKTYIVHGTNGPHDGQHKHWVVEEGKHPKQGFYHRTDRMHKPTSMKKNEDEHQDLEHYSPKAGLKSIDPKFKRTGVDQASRSNQLSHDISFFYPKGTEPEHVVLQPAKSKYTVRLGKDHKIFDAAQHGNEHIQAVKDANQGVFNLDNFISRLKEHGFHGFKTTPQGIPMVALFDSAKVHSEEPVDKVQKSEQNDLMKAKNVKEQKEKVWGRTSQPSAKSPQREKHMEHIRDYAQRRYGLEMKPSGGKVDVKTGQRRAENPEVGVDKPDWRSGQLEAQANPDAMVHELGHLEIMPPGVGLEQGQTYMDKQYADVQRQHGYMKQKQSQGEIQPMGVEQLLRRRMGLPANRSAVPVKSADAPPRMAVDTGTLAGTRVPMGQTKQGQTKYADLIRQSRFVSPENRERVDKIDRGELVYDKQKGWVKPDISSKEGLKQNINALINVRAREKAKDPTRKDASTLMRSENPDDGEE